MSSGTYKRFYNMAVKRLSNGDLGTPITVTREGVQSFDPSTGEVVQVAEVIETSGVKMAIKQYLVDGELILKGDVDFYISPEDSDGVIMPMLDSSDKISFLGETFVVVNSRPWDFSGLSIGQKIHARRG